MSSLPDAFDVQEENNIHPSHTHTEPQDYRQREVVRASNSNTMAFSVAVVSLVLSVIVFALAVEKPVTQIKSWFGGKPTSVMSMLDAQQAQLNRQDKTLEQYTSELSSTKITVGRLQEQLADFKNELINSNSRMSDLERRYQELQADITVLNKPKPAPKPIVIEKPKVPEKPTVSVTLSSIRIQGGVSWVSLHDGLEMSPLLTLGDEWHNAKLIAADPIKKEAQLFINGFTTAVRL